MDINDVTTIHFEESFFKEEERCGALVTKKLKQIWAVELDLLNQVDLICKKHNIKYCAYSGTILGAVRHKGFIPWDDDLDICMTRDEYEKFLKVAPLELGPQYFLQNALSDPKYFVGYSRLRNSLTTGAINGHDDINYNNGIFIDIYVIDGYTDNARDLRRQRRDKDFVEALLNCYNLGYPEKRLWRQMISIILHHTMCRIIPYETIYKLYVKILDRYGKSATRYTLLTHVDWIYKKYWCEKIDIAETIYQDFENIKIAIPKNYDNILKNMYGDYMKFPPVEQRGAWHEGIIKFIPDMPYKDYFKTLNK